jgi:hypothetical protein
MLSNTLLEVKIKKFSQTVKKDNLQNVIKLKLRRKIAKAIYRLCLPILNEFARRLLDGDLRSTGTEPEDIPERPFLRFNIPQELIEQKF